MIKHLAWPLRLALSAMTGSVSYYGEPLDFMFDTTANGPPFKVLTICDQVTGESLGGRLDRSITADDVVAVLEQLCRERGAPEHTRCYSGPEFISAAIWDWCPFSGIGTSFIDPSSPWQNAYAERFKGQIRDQLVTWEILDSFWEARVLNEDGRYACNLYRPRRSLGLELPAVFAAAFNNQVRSSAFGLMNGERSVDSDGNITAPAFGDKRVHDRRMGALRECWMECASMVLFGRLAVDLWHRVLHSDPCD